MLTDVREADVGAILGFGFAPFTGGPLSYIDTMGACELRRQVPLLRKAAWPTLQACQAAHPDGESRRHFLRPLHAQGCGCRLTCSASPAARSTAKPIIAATPNGSRKRRADPTARLIRLNGDKVALNGGSIAHEALADDVTCVFLGRDAKGAPAFAAETTEPIAGGIDLRSIANQGLLPPPNWRCSRRRARSFTGISGIASAPIAALHTEIADAGYRRHCGELRSRSFSPHRSGRHHRRALGARLPARAAVLMAARHVFGARRFHGARRDDRGSGAPRSRGGVGDQGGARHLCREPALAVSLKLDDRPYRRSACRRTSASIPRNSKMRAGLPPRNSRPCATGSTPTACASRFRWPSPTISSWPRSTSPDRPRATFRHNRFAAIFLLPAKRGEG